MSDDLQPWLIALSTPSSTRSLGASLPADRMPAGVSPWGPHAAPNTDEATVRELHQLKAAAANEGRAIGMKETEDLRAKLAATIKALDAQRTASTAKASELIADAAIAVIETWLEREIDAKERFTPLVRGWLQKTGEGGNAIAKCHPSDVAALKEAVGEALISVEADPAIAKHSVRIASTNLEIDHDWSARIAELRQVIATAADGADQ